MTAYRTIRLTTFYLFRISEIEMDHIKYDNSNISCVYGFDPYDILEYHVFSIALAVPTAYFLFNNSNLRKFYLPLYHLVNAAIMLNFLTSGFYFWYFPYNKGDGNCPEIVLSRIKAIIIMFAELHQIYIISFSLGVTRLKLPCLSLSSPLEVIFKYGIYFMILSIVGSFCFATHNSLIITENTWTILISFVQLIILQIARGNDNELLSTNKLISIGDTAVQFFEKLTFIQLILLSGCASYRLAFSIFKYQLLGNLNVILAIIDDVVVFIFFLKALLVTAKSQVTLEIV